MTGDLSFVVLGRPQGKGSKRPIWSKRVLIDDNAKARPWHNRVAAAALEAVEANPSALPALVRGPVSISFAFYFARPRGHYGVGRNINRLRPSAPAHMATMPDVDKLARCTLDALVGTLIKDDGQATALHAVKRYGEPERAEIRLRVLA